MTALANKQEVETTEDRGAAFSLSCWGPQQPSYASSWRQPSEESRARSESSAIHHDRTVGRLSFQWDSGVVIDPNNLGVAARFFTNSLWILRDFFSSQLTSSRRMGSANEAWLCLLLVAMFGLVLFLRIKSPDPSRARETGVLVVATIFLFLFCSLFLRSPATTVQKFGQAQASTSTR